MPPEDSSVPRKVRSACRRCRQKRVKCDGEIPACSNCARAKVPCIDVHTGNNTLSIPRDFAVRCCARIRWLEQNLGSLCPDFDLSQGPGVNADFMETLTPQENSAAFNVSSRSEANELESHMQQEDLEDRTPNKRPRSAMESDADSPLSANARSVAIDLGMLSLQSDSRQTHYLGSSSGLFFAKLIGINDNQRAEQAVLTARRPTLLHMSDDYRSLYGQLKQELPPPKQASHLLEVYFHNIQFDHPFLHPASLINAYNALYMCSQAGHDGFVDRNGWISTVEPFSYNGRTDHIAGRDVTPISISTAVFHVFAAFSLSSTILTRKKNYEFSPARFQRVAMSVASETFSSISVTSLQATLLLAVQSLIEPAGLNVWTLSHIAMSHCIDLGLHREPHDAITPSGTRIIQRFIFWTVYSMDRSISTIQGRPLGIRDETFDILLPSETDALEMLKLPEVNFTIKLPHMQFVLLSIMRFRLEQHISEIKLLLYHLPTRTTSFIWPTNTTEIQTKIKLDLDKWLLGAQQIASADDMTDEEHSNLKMQTLRHEQLYYAAICLLYQPSQVFPSPSKEALYLCYQSCSKRLQIYDMVGNKDMLFYNWRNIHGIFSSGATIVYSIWMSRELQETVPFSKLLRDFRTCSNHLSIGSQWWPSVRTGRESFEVMIDFMIKYLGDPKGPIQASNTSNPRNPRSTSSHTESSQPPPSYHSISNHERNLPSFDTMPRGPAQTRSQQGGVVDRHHPFGTRRCSASNNSPQNSASVGSLIQSYNTAVNEPQTFLGAMDPSISMDFTSDLESPAIEAAMENFMAEYLHEDWSWDPFCTSTGIFDLQEN